MVAKPEVRQECDDWARHGYAPLGELQYCRIAGLQKGSSDAKVSTSAILPAILQFCNPAIP
jgi:hypothetical protein